VRGATLENVVVRHQLKRDCVGDAVEAATSRDPARRDSRRVEPLAEFVNEACRFRDAPRAAHQLFKQRPIEGRNIGHLVPLLAGQRLSHDENGTNAKRRH
jgi:hypothetical protein